MHIDKHVLKELKASKFGQLKALQLMESSVRSETDDASGELVASLLMEGFGSVPIVDQNDRLIGIVSEFDLLNAISRGRKLAQVTAGDIMTSSPISVTQDTDILAVIEVLQSNHLIRVPVVSSSGKLIGVLARRDILRGYLQSSI